MKQFFKTQLGYVLFGFIAWLLPGILIFFLSWIYGNTEELGEKVLRLLLPSNLIYPGLGFLLAALFFYISGLLFKKTPLGKIFAKIPIIGLFFVQSGGKVMTIDMLLKLPPCQFLFSPTCPSWGWILSEEEVSLNGTEGKFTMINVYYPNVPTIVTGQTFPVRKETVMKLGNSSIEIINLLLFSLKSPKSIKYLPWEDESDADFEKRARSFGLNIANIESTDN